MDLINEIKKTHLDLNKKVDLNKKEILKIKADIILYFLYGYFWKKYQQELFSGEFAINDSTLFEVNNLKNKARLNKEKREFIKDKISRLLVYATWFLMEQLKMTKPWMDAFNSNKNPKKIDNNKIQDFFGKLD